MLPHRTPEWKRITCDLSIRLVLGTGDRQPLAGHLSFDPADPMAVTLVIRTPLSDPVRWTFARSLLAATSPDSVGVGDVQVLPTSGHKGRAMTLKLTSPTGNAELELSTHRVAAFLRRTYAMVPREIEAGLIDWESEFGPLLRV
jgi:hypothetical protein